MSRSYENVTIFDLTNKHGSNFAHDEIDANVNVPVWLVIVMLSISAWIIIANGLVFVCLVSSRNALKNNVNVQLLSLSLTDMLVGITTIPGVLKSIPKFYSNYELCAVVLYLYMVAQTATLYHTLLICMHRLLAIKGKTNHANFKAVLWQTIVVWFGSLLFYTIHFLTFARFGETGLVQCSFYYLFADDYRLAFGLLSIPSLVPPHICTNIMYVYLLIFIRKKLRVVGVLKVKPNNTPDHAKLRGNKENTLLGVAMHTSHHRSVYRTPSDTKEGPDARIWVSEANSLSTNDQQPSMSKGYKPKSIDNNEQNVKFPAALNIVASRNVAQPEHSGINTNRIGLEKQKRVLITFGILLVSLNIFMTPLDFVAIIEMFTVVLIFVPFASYIRFHIFI